MSLTKIFSCISIMDFVLYVLLIVAQGHSTWENKVNTLTIKTAPYSPWARRGHHAPPKDAAGVV